MGVKCIEKLLSKEFDIELIYLKWFQVLNNFIKKQIISYGNDEGHPLGSVLSEMCIDTWGQRKPADPAIWQDWVIVMEEIFNDYNFEKIRNLNEEKYARKEQVFMGAFNFLNEFYWDKNNNINLGEVLKDIEKCINEIGEGKENNTWREWVRYFDMEKNNEYHFE